MTNHTMTEVSDLSIRKGTNNNFYIHFTNKEGGFNFISVVAVTTILLGRQQLEKLNFLIGAELQDEDVRGDMASGKV